MMHDLPLSRALVSPQTHAAVALISDPSACAVPCVQSWELALFAPSAFLMISGALVYVLACKNEPVDFDSTDNGPFAWEPRLPSFGQGNKP